MEGRPDIQSGDDGQKCRELGRVGCVVPGVHGDAMRLNVIETRDGF